MKYNKGFAPLVVLLIVLGVLAVGGVAYFAGKSSTPKNEVSDNSNYFPTTEQNYTPPTTNNNPPAQTPPPSNNPPPATSTACNSNSPSTIKVLSLNGGEIYQAGQQITVKWKSCNVTPNSIGIILIKHNPAVPYTQSEGQGDYAGFSLGNYSTADDGTEQITLPPSSNSNLTSGQHYFISVVGLGDATNIGSGYTPGDYSNGLFTINNTNTTACNSNSPSTIKVLSPNGGEVYQAGEQISIKWESCNVTPGSIGLILIKHNPSLPYIQSEGTGDYAGFNLGGFNPYTGTADDGIEQVTLPTHADSNLTAGQHYFISVSGLGDTTHIGSGYTPGDYSNNLFTIN